VLLAGRFDSASVAGVDVVVEVVVVELVVVEDVPEPDDVVDVDDVERLKRSIDMSVSVVESDALVATL